MEELKRFDDSFLRVNFWLRRRMDITTSKYGISGAQARYLGFISHNCRNKDVYQKDIEKAFNIRRSTASGILKNLETKGLIDRVSVSSDARLKKLVLTDKARELEDKIVTLIDENEKILAKGLNEDEKEIFHNMIKKIIAQIEIVDREEK